MQDSVLRDRRTIRLGYTKAKSQKPMTWCWDHMGKIVAGWVEKLKIQFSIKSKIKKKKPAISR